MAKPLPLEFVNYLKGWPTAREAIFGKEIRRIYAMPEVHDRFDELNIPPEKRDALVRAKAAENAQALAMQELQHVRQHYGVDELTPDALKQALAAHDQQFAPREKDAEIAAQFGRNAHADYAKQSQVDVANKFKEMSSYVPFDQNMAQGPTVDMPAEDMSAPGGDEGAIKPGSPNDPIREYMLGAAQQGAQQEAGKPVTDPVLPQTSAPMASAGESNANHP